MKRRKRKRWSDSQKAKVVAFSLSHTMTETALEFGCSKGSVSAWVKAAGVEREVDRKAQTEAATEAHVLSAKEKRKQAREDLATATANLAARLAATSLDEVPPRELWQYATTIDVATKTIRLEEGEPTGRQEVLHEYPDIASLSDDELDAEIVREAERITRGEAAPGK